MDNDYEQQCVRIDIYRDIEIGMFSATVRIEWLTHRESPKERMFSFPKLKVLSIFSRERERRRRRDCSLCISTGLIYVNMERDRQIPE